MSTHIISLLIEERDRINAAIAALHGPTATPVKEAPAAAPEAVAPKKRTMSAAGRRAIIQATKKRWAAIRAAKAAAPLAEEPAAKKADLNNKLSERMKASWATRKKAAKKTT